MKRSLICMGIGAGLMYLMDPELGETRRSMLRDRLQGVLPETNDALSHKAEEVVTKASQLSEKADHVAAETIESLNTDAIKGQGSGQQSQSQSKPNS